MDETNRQLLDDVQTPWPVQPGQTARVDEYQQRQGVALAGVVNIVSKEQLLEAHADPSTHPDLVVRVTGYSAHFKSLSREYRQPIVDRILAEI